MRFRLRPNVKIGMRTVKTALAVTIAITIAYILNLDSPFFVAIAAIITLQGNIVDSVRMGRDRILGTIIGALAGLAFSYLALGNPIIIGLGIIGLIYVSNLINFKKTISISSVVFVSIMLDFGGGNLIYSSLNRVIDTFVGITVAVLVNLAISPPFSRDIVTAACKDLVKDCSKVIISLVTKEEFSLTQIENELAILEREYPTYKREEETHLVKEGEVNVHEARVLVNKLFHNIHLLAEMGTEHKISPDNSALLYSVYQIEKSSDDNLTNEDRVYNYLLTKSIKIITELSEAFKS
ncbi:FUSC family protein [Alkalicella caledoniensis]|uniref:FUSC family protein n=1 Tax=Alkalicella caledoniensis TaxID=2731377 RepID=A0A7G9W7C1_ALKCA|nr:aromatic acid exporter family protein [Alkalicella caledoniensis]QNO14583.1 FUSC family protein [Alkalicella caledoniensis]